MITILLMVLFVVGAFVWFRPSWVQYNDPWERWPDNGDAHVVTGIIVMLAALASIVSRLVLSFD